MNFSEREQEQRRRMEKFRIPLVRCLHCRFTVPKTEQETHLARCPRAPLAVDRSRRIDDHFEDVER